MKKGDEPAFPTEFSKSGFDPLISGGLTKREWLAGMAMQGMLANARILETLMEEKLAPSVMIDRTTKTSYLFADAMLAFEEKEAGEKE